MGLTVTLAGQDISDFVDESSIDIVSVLGQGPGAGSEGSGQSTTCEFIADLGPMPTAIGAGQSRSSTYKEVVSSDSPLGYYRMDTETACPDASGHSNTGTVVNGPLTLSSGSTGDQNPAWLSNGNTYVQLPLVLTSTDNVTLEAVVLFDGAFYHGPLVQCGDDGTGYGIGIGDGTDWDHSGTHLMLRVGNTYYEPAGHALVPNDGAWHTVAVKLSGGTATFFVDSVNKGTATGYTVVAPTGHCYIGATSGGLRAYLLGIDEVALYGTALADARFGAHFGALSVGPVLVRQGEVIVTDATGTVVFGGYATHFEDATEQQGLVIKTKISCHDYMQDIDRVEVNNVYIGVDDVYIIRDLCTTYAPWLDLSGVPATGTYLFDKRYVRAKSLRVAIQKLAAVTGFLVWITPDKVLHYAAPTDASNAPFTLSDEPDFIGSFSYDIASWSVDDNAIINRVYFYGGKQTSDDFTQDLSIQANGSNDSFQLLYYPHNAADGKIHVKKNGVDLVVGTPFEKGNDGKLKRDGGNRDVLLNADAETLTFSTAPASTDTLVAIYRYNTPLVVTVGDKSSQGFYGRYFDGKLDDQTVLDQDTAIQRSRVLLAQQSFGLEALQIVCWQAGLQAGQLVQVTNAIQGLNAKTYAIQKVETKPLGAGHFEYTVDLGAWNWNMVDLLFATARRAGPQDTSTDEDTSVVQAQETLEAATVAVVTNLTTKTSGQYYSRSTSVGDNHDAYSGFFTITS